MRTQNLIKAFFRIICVLFLSINSIYAQSESESNIEVTKIKDDFYKLTSKIPYESNFVAYVTHNGVLLVDAGQRQTGPELKNVLQTIAKGNSQVKYLINSHAHIDHTGGNLCLSEETVIVGTESLRSTLRDYSYVLYEFPDKALPSITFTDSMTIYFGDEMIRLIAVPGSHDKTDILVHFTKAGIVYMSDISYGMYFPSIDSYTGNLLNYPKVIKQILKMIPEDVTIISGHGKDCSFEDIKNYGEMLEIAANRVKEGMLDGKDIKTLQEEDILKDLSFSGSEDKAIRDSYIIRLANAGPSKFKNSIVKELYDVLISSNADEAIIKYYQLKKDFPGQYPFDPVLIDRVGNWLVTKQRIKDAIKIFELAINESPNSWRFYNNIAEAYLLNGNKELAIKNYEKSLELNQQNTNAVEQLKKLK